MYCDSWKLKINVDKTKVIICSNGKIDTKSLKFMIHNSEIEIVEKYKYLGVVLFDNGNLKYAANHLHQKSLKAIFSLKSKVLDLDALSNSLQLKLFDILIRLILTYDSEIWISDLTIKDKTLDSL